MLLRLKGRGAGAMEAALSRNGDAAYLVREIGGTEVDLLYRAKNILIAKSVCVTNFSDNSRYRAHGGGRRMIGEFCSDPANLTCKYTECSECTTSLLKRKEKFLQFKMRNCLCPAALRLQPSRSNKYGPLISILRKYILLSQ